MKRVVIRQCPVCAEIRANAARVAEQLRMEPDLEVSLIDGDRGEFRVLLDGRTIAQKEGDKLPSPEEVLAAVRQKEQVAA